MAVSMGLQYRVSKRFKKTYIVGNQAVSDARSLLRYQLMPLAYGWGESAVKRT